MQTKYSQNFCSNKRGFLAYKETKKIVLRDLVHAYAPDSFADALPLN